MTYAEKLKDPRWEIFRNKVFDAMGCACSTCGDQDKPATRFNHVHHKRYIKGREPWEYDLTDVTVLCKECHDEIHQCENKWRSMIRAMPSWLVAEFDSMADDFMKMDPEDYVGWASYCKNEARALNGFNRNKANLYDNES
jgi:hypothetical protein